MFATQDVGWFSSDSHYVAIGGDALYELKTGKKRYPLPPGIINFSPDSQYFAVWGAATGAVYDTATGKPIITTQGSTPVFSADSQYVAISSDGVYNLKTQTKLISTISPDGKTFSSDSSLIAIANDGVYELPSAKRRFKIAGDKFIPPQFIKDTNYLVISGDAVYDLKTNQSLYRILRPTAISKTGDFMVINLEGIIETATGKVKQLTRANYMAADNKILFWNFQTEVGTSCLIFGVKGDKWPYRMGMVEISGNTLFYDEPNGKTVKTDARGRRLFVIAQQIVYAQTADKQWLRLREHYWVKASEVRPLWLPDDLPIDKPS